MNYIANYILIYIIFDRTIYTIEEILTFAYIRAKDSLHLRAAATLLAFAYT